MRKGCERVEDKASQLARLVRLRTASKSIRTCSMTLSGALARSSGLLSPPISLPLPLLDPSLSSRINSSHPS